MPGQRRLRRHVVIGERTDDAPADRRCLTKRGEERVEVCRALVAGLLFDGVTGAAGKFEIVGDLVVHLAEERIRVAGVVVIAAEQIGLAGHRIRSQIADASVLSEGAAVMLVEKAA